MDIKDLYIGLGPDRGAVPQKGQKEKFYTGKGMTTHSLISISLLKVDGHYIKLVYDLPDEEFKEHEFVNFEYFINDKGEPNLVDNEINEILDGDLSKSYFCFRINYMESPLTEEVSNAGLEYVLPNLSQFKEFETHTAESLTDSCFYFNQNELFLCVGIFYSTDYWGESDVDYELIGYYNQFKELVKI